LLWSGTNAAVDLNPAGFDISEATDTNGSVQIGYGIGPGTRNLNHALLWNGNNAATDLGALLVTVLPISRAYAVDSTGNVFGWASNGREFYSVEWVPTVPEPRSSLALVGVMSILGCKRSMKGRSCSLSTPIWRRFRGFTP
jgi:hypothetical protein